MSFSLHGGPLSGWGIVGIIPSAQLYQIIGTLSSAIPYQVQPAKWPFKAHLLNEVSVLIRANHAPGLSAQRIRSALQAPPVSMSLDPTADVADQQWFRLTETVEGTQLTMRAIRAHLEYARSRSREELPVEIMFLFNTIDLEVRKDALNGQFDRLRNTTEGLASMRYRQRRTSSVPHRLNRT